MNIASVIKIYIYLKLFKVYVISTKQLLMINLLNTFNDI
jgi:hypothetical protein